MFIMKSYSTIIFCVFFIFLNSCDRKALDIVPNGRITLDIVFEDETKAEAFLNTVYGYIPAYYWSYTNHSMLAGSSDEAEDSMVGNGAPNINARWNIGQLSPANNPSIDYYSNYWSGIQTANIFIEKIKDTKFESEERKQRLIAEAHVLRAFYYWELTKQYGPMPIFELAPSTNFDFSALIRPTFEDVIDFIVKDCDIAINNLYLPKRVDLQSEKYRMTSSIAYAIKSQSLLYQASPLWNPENDNSKWKKAATAAKEALDFVTRDETFKLEGNYEQYFLSTSITDRETIFEINKSNGALLNVMHGIPSNPATSKTGVTPTQELVDAYEMQATGEPVVIGYEDGDHLKPIYNPISGYDPQNPYVGRDPRFYATVWYNGALYDNINGKVHTIETFVGGKDQLLKTPPNTKNTHTGYYLRKYLDPKIQASQGHTTSWKKIRLAELYLNYAEAENELNGPVPAVYSAVNMVRNRVNMPDLPTGLSKEKMRERIRNERRVELAFEEHRFWDVRRWKILHQTDKLITGMEIRKDQANQFTYSRFVVSRREAWDTRYLLFPIPISDASSILDLSKNQNPGW